MWRVSKKSGDKCTCFYLKRGDHSNQTVFYMNIQKGLEIRKSGEGGREDSEVLVINSAWGPELRWRQECKGCNAKCVPVLAFQVDDKLTKVRSTANTYPYSFFTSTSLSFAALDVSFSPFLRRVKNFTIGFRCNM